MQARPDDSPQPSSVIREPDLLQSRLVLSSGRGYARVYERVQRRAAHGAILDAVEAAGGRVLFATAPNTAPLFVAVEGPDGDRTGICAYVFSANQVTTRN